MNNIDRSDSFFARNKYVMWIFLILIFGLGLVIRLYDLTDLPLDFHGTRQLHSALMARGMYYQNLESEPEWKRDMAVQQWKAEGLIEPPVMERLTALTYSIVGNDYLWIPRLYSILFWMLGAVGLFMLIKEITGIDGAFIGLIYFLILPYGAIASRAFQPDPLLTSLLIFSYWAIVKWHKNQNWKWSIISGVFGGAAIFIKSTAVFFIAPVWIGLVFFSIGFIKAIKMPKIWVIALLSTVPCIIFHIYGVYITGLLTSQFALRFFPNMWPDPVFYLQWNGELSSVVGFEWFLLSILGIFLLKKKEHRIMLISLWAGYFIYGMTFPHHISTHDYYQLPIVPLVAIGLGAGTEVLFRNIKGKKWLYTIAVFGVILFGVTIKAWDVRVTLKRMDYRPEQLFWEELGDVLGPSASVVGLTHDYGYRMSYWSWITPENWMTTGDIEYRELAGYDIDIQTIFDEQTAGKDYFVVTLLGEFDNQPELKNILSNYPIIAKADEYIIYDLRNPLPTEE